MFACMARVTAKVFSELTLSVRYSDSVPTDPQQFSDDIVHAAWESGLGVHALIWVCNIAGEMVSFRLDFSSLGSLVTMSGSGVEIRFLPLYIRIPKPSS